MAVIILLQCLVPLVHQRCCHLLVYTLPPKDEIYQTCCDPSPSQNPKLQVWVTDRQDPRVTDILQPSTLARCVA